MSGLLKSERLRFTTLGIVLGVIGCLAASVLRPLFYMFLYAALALFDSGPMWEAPTVKFTRTTGLPWPQTAMIHRAGENWNKLSGDGELFLVFEADADVIGDWLSEQTPWRATRWNTGGVPDDIRAHCLFGGASEHQDALSATTIQWCALDHKRTNLAWHNGQLLAIDPKTRRVYLCCWEN